MDYSQRAQLAQVRLDEETSEEKESDLVKSYTNESVLHLSKTRNPSISAPPGVHHVQTNSKLGKFFEFGRFRATRLLPVALGQRQLNLPALAQHLGRRPNEFAEQWVRLLGA